jgi:mannose-6-phosphate isomerase
MAVAVPDYPLLMTPHFSARPWGGRGLQTVLGKPLPEGEVIGESWELSDHPNGRSRVANGVFAGREFGELYKQFPREMVGSTSVPERFPLLVKFIDAQEDLSIQVHPNDEQARAIGDRGKTECWYVMDCAPSTEILFGLKGGVSAEDLRRGAVSGEIEEQVASYPAHADDFLYVRAGTVHAICGGTLICEVQQSSDTTYRLWDWNREPKRALHVEESIAAIDWKAQPPQPLAVPPKGAGVWSPMALVENEFFRVSVVDVGDAGLQLESPLRNGQIVVVLSGEGKLESGSFQEDLRKGQTWFLPALLGSGVRVRGEKNNPVRLLIAESREICAE